MTWVRNMRNAVAAGAVAAEVKIRLRSKESGSALNTRVWVYTMAGAAACATSGPLDGAASLSGGAIATLGGAGMAPGGATTVPGG
jgi:hypothetical protein